MRRDRENAAQVGRVVVGVFDVGLGRRRVKRLEVPVDLGAQVVVMIGRQVYVLRRQQGQAEYA